MKYFFIFLSITVLSGVIFNGFSERNEVEFAKAGLEQCPDKPFNLTYAHPIWVKDCKTYINTMKGIQ